MTKTPQRFAWAAACLQLSPSHRVLELGCGAGLLVAEMLTYLKTGSVTAIDKSAPMIAKATKRNADAVKAGKAVFHQVDLADYTGREKFDMVTAFNFNVFTKFPVKEMDIVKGLLGSGAELFVFYQAPYELTRADSRPIIHGLRQFGFDTIGMSLKNFDQGNAMLIRATLSKN
jgi:SAM-dependent methyltransferase